MRRAYRWGIAILGLLCVAGIAVVCSAPTDEYVVFNRLGPVTEVPHDSEMFPFPPAIGYEALRRRQWEVNVPEPEARQVVDRFLSLNPGWDKGGRENDHMVGEDFETTRNAKSYSNNNTEDRLHFSKEVRTSGKRKTTRLTLTVAESKASYRFLTRIKRWLHLLPPR